MLPNIRCLIRSIKSYFVFVCGITHLEIQIFARKLVRPFGSVSNEDVLNEARAIDLLQSQGTSENIDMELCQLTLEDCLERRGPTSGLYLASRNPDCLGLFSLCAKPATHGISWNKSRSESNTYMLANKFIET